MKNVVPLKVIFFDLGDTLVKQNPDGGSRKIWIEGAQEAIAQLNGKGVRLGIISNTGTLERHELFDDLLPTDFNADVFEENLIILSSEVDAVKPKLRIFAHAIDNAGVAPVECLFCTEDLSHTLAAQEIGMRAVWLQLDDIKRLADKLIEDDSFLLA
jgi:FMN phosphatase YigB (HAD superfamily)